MARQARRGPHIASNISLALLRVMLYPEKAVSPARQVQGLPYLSPYRPRHSYRDRARLVMRFVNNFQRVRREVEAVL